MRESQRAEAFIQAPEGAAGDYGIVVRRRVQGRVYTSVPAGIARGIEVEMFLACFDCKTLSNNRL